MLAGRGLSPLGRRGSKKRQNSRLEQTGGKFLFNLFFASEIGFFRMFGSSSGGGFAWKELINTSTPFPLRYFLLQNYLLVSLRQIFYAFQMLIPPEAEFSVGSEIETIIFFSLSRNTCFQD